MKKKRFSLIAAVILAFCILLLLLCRLFWLEPFHVAADSMAPALLKGDLVIVNKLAYRSAEPQRGDIVLISTAKFPTEKARSDKYWLKRIIAVPTDRVRIKPPRIYVNDSPLEDYSGFEFPDKVKFPNAQLFTDANELTLLERRYFLIGDNIAGSIDSRHFGPVKASAIVGKVNCILFPPNRCGCVK